MKKKGLPWSAAKGFDTFTPIGWVCHANTLCAIRLEPVARSFIPKSSILDAHNLNLSLKVRLI